MAVFASGTGTNAQKLIEYFKNSSLANVALIVCNKPGAGVLSIAEKENIPSLLIEKENFFRGDAYLPELKKAGIDFIVLAGFLFSEVVVDPPVSPLPWAKGALEKGLP